MAENEQDPLAAINAALHKQDIAEDDPNSPWLPLESNPVSENNQNQPTTTMTLLHFGIFGKAARGCPCRNLYLFRNDEELRNNIRQPKNERLTKWNNLVLFFQEVFTDFARKSGGLPKDWGWTDILGLDPELLNMVPEPCAGVILLFPCSDKIYEQRAAQKARLVQEGATAAAAKAYHVAQVPEFGNACGTIASVHALINGAHVYNQDPNQQSPLSQFRDGHANASAEDRGKALLSTSALRSSSDQSASHMAAQTACPDRNGPELDHHFVTFSPVAGEQGSSVSDTIHVVELDGTKILPVDHGTIADILADDDTEVEDPNKHLFLRAVAKVIKERYMDVEPDSIEFSMMALCKIKQKNISCNISADKSCFYAMDRTLQREKINNCERSQSIFGVKL